MSRYRIVLFTLILVVLGGSGFAWWSRVQRPPAPDSDLVVQATPTEILAHIRAARAPVTVVNLWAQWCEPCKREFPHFLRLRREGADRGVRVLFVSVDDRADVGEVDAFLRAEGVDFPTFYKGRQSLNFVAELDPKWSGAIPATLLFGPNAEILDAWEGDTTWKELIAKTSAALARPSNEKTSE